MTDHHNVGRSFGAGLSYRIDDQLAIDFVFVLDHRPHVLGALPRADEDRPRRGDDHDVAHPDERHERALGLDERARSVGGDEPALPGSTFPAASAPRTS